jgi:hypothetical protein
MRRKTIEESVAATREEGSQLRREPSGFDVIVFGIGVMIGAGTFVLTSRLVMPPERAPHARAQAGTTIRPFSAAGEGHGRGGRHRRRERCHGGRS